MKKITKIIIPLAIFSILILPILSHAQDAVFTYDEEKGLIPCGKTLIAPVRVDGISYKIGDVIPCNFNDLMTLVDNVIKFILYYLAVPISAIMFFYAGFLLVTSGGSTENRGRAKSIFTNTAKGLIFIAAAYLIVKQILSILGYNGSWIGF